MTDAVTGEPIAGAAVECRPQQVNNPHLRAGVAGGAGETKGKGVFEFPVLPGQCHFLVQGPTSDYVHDEVTSGMLHSGRPYGTRLYPNAVVRLDVPRAGLNAEVSIKLRKGVTVRGGVIGPAGQPLGRLLVLHRLYLGLDMEWRRPFELQEGRFEIHGIDPDKSFPVYFLDPVNRWGTTAQISGKQAAAPVVIRLEPCGQATARFVDSDKKPLVNVRAGADRFNIVVTPGECHFSSNRDRICADEASVVNIDQHNYWNLPGTDANGRITLPALIPGATYRILGYEKNHFVVRRDFAAKPGETLELGDIVIREAK